MATENDIKFKLKCYKMTASDSINFICNIGDMINDIFISITRLTDNELFILCLMKYFVFKSAAVMDKLWSSPNVQSNDDIINDERLFLKFLDSMMPNTLMVQPKWFLYVMLHHFI